MEETPVRKYFLSLFQVALTVFDECLLVVCVRFVGQVFHVRSGSSSKLYVEARIVFVSSSSVSLLSSSSVVTDSEQVSRIVRAMFSMVAGCFVF